MINKTITFTHTAILDIVNEHEIDEKKSDLSEKGLQTYRKYIILFSNVLSSHLSQLYGHH